MTERPKIAMYWLGACGGCDSTMIDLGEILLELANKLEIVIWPVAMDFKHDRLEELPDNSIAISILSGCINNSDHLKISRLFRAKSRIILSCGACACFGGIPGLANLRPEEEIIDRIYIHSPTVTNPTGSRPEISTAINGIELRLPKFFSHTYALNQAIEVDYYLPGCPPPSELLQEAISCLLKDRLPQRGTTLAPRKPLCDSCPRNGNKPHRMQIQKIYRYHEIEIPPYDCFLAHGVICMGPATRDGCGGSCLSTNTPCRGCFGAIEGVTDAGARFLSSLAAILEPENEDALHLLLSSFVDPAGLVCRFTQAVSILGERKMPKEEDERCPKE